MTAVALGTGGHLLRRSLVHELDEPAQDGWIGVRKDAVTEVEDVARAPARPLENVKRPRLGAFPRPEQQRGIEVTLHSPAFADVGPALVERDPPVEADHV